MSDPGSFNLASQDEVSFEYYGGSTRLEISYGDGSSEKRHLQYGPDYFYHTYANDGEYDLTVKSTGREVDLFHLHAYLYFEMTTDLIVKGSGDLEYVESGSGNDSIDLGGGNDAASGGLGDDALSGGSGDDRLDGMAGNDVLRGGTGDDALSNSYGEAGEVNQLFGGAGDDLIFNSIGEDLLEGGVGRDRFTLSIKHDFIGIGQDEIVDFSGVNGEGDKISVPLKGVFIGDSQFDGEHRELRVISGNRASEYIVEIDSDRDGKTDASFIVRGDKPTADDFFGVKAERYHAQEHKILDNHPFHDLITDHPVLSHSVIV